MSPNRSLVDRRAFLKACTAAAIAVGIDTELCARIAAAVASPDRPPVLWLHFQECTGCSETLLRTTHPSLAALLLELISLDYHETLAAAAGKQVEENLRRSLKRDAGRYILVIEGAIPTREGGIDCKIAGRTALEILQECAAQAAAIIAVGSCASFGGIVASPPNPTEARGAAWILSDKTVLTVPGCPPNPYNLLGTILYFLSYGRLPELDGKGRPLFAYGRTIHEHCPRRPHFDAGRFAKAFGDEGHRQGWCLYELGCKGPQTFANCSTHDFCEVVGAWPIGIGHPCVGCTEQDLAFRVPLHETIEVPFPTPAADHPPMVPPLRGREGIDPVSTGFAGLVGGVLIGAAWMAGRRIDEVQHAEEPPEEEV